MGIGKAVIMTLLDEWLSRHFSLHLSHPALTQWIEELLNEEIIFINLLSIHDNTMIHLHFSVCWVEFWSMEHHIPQIMSELAHVNASSIKLKQSLSLNRALFIYTHNNTASLNVEKPRESKEYSWLWRDGPGLELVANGCSIYFLSPLLALLDLFKGKKKKKRSHEMDMIRLWTPLKIQL